MVVVCSGFRRVDVSVFHLPRRVVLAGLGPVNAVVGGRGAGRVPGHGEFTCAGAGELQVGDGARVALGFGGEAAQRQCGDYSS